MSVVYKIGLELIVIDWLDTAKKYGYSSLPAAKRPLVVCVCDQCQKHKPITIRVRSKLRNDQMLWLCPACIKLRESTTISARMTEQWDKEEYKQQRATCSKNMWQKEGYKEKHSKAVKAGMRGIAKATTPASDTSLSDSLKLKWQDPEYRSRVTKALAKQNVRDKIAVSTRRSWKNEQFRQALATARTNQPRISSLQKQLYGILDSLGIKYFSEGQDTQIGYYSFDCLVENDNKKLLIECQGDYWHSLPKTIRSDKAKFTYITKYFPEYEVLFLWEREFSSHDKIIDKLKSKLLLNRNCVDFDLKTCIVRSINAHTANDFYDIYHYLGKSRGGDHIGVFVDDKLIACCTISPPLRQNISGQFNLTDDDVREISRLCIHYSYHKKNFASWFLRRVLKQVQYKLIVAYADTTAGHIGTIYKAANFQLHHTVPADYWYVDQDGYVLHKKTLYNKASRLQMKEKEFANKYGYIKKYGGEKLCFIYRLNRYA